MLIQIRPDNSVYIETYEDKGTRKLLLLPLLQLSCVVVGIITAFCVLACVAGRSFNGLNVLDQLFDRKTSQHTKEAVKSVSQLSGFAVPPGANALKKAIVKVWYGHWRAY